MGSPPRPADPKKPDPVARAPRPGAEGETGSAQRRTRQRALSRLGPQASLIAGETGGFGGGAATILRGGRAILGG